MKCDWCGEDNYPFWELESVRRLKPHLPIFYTMRGKFQRNEWVCKECLAKEAACEDESPML